MLRFFDYIQYRVCGFYLKHHGTSPEGTSMVVVSLMQLLNIFSIFEIFCIIQRKNYPLSTPVILLFVILLIFLNGRRYYKFDYSTLKDKWLESEGIEKTRKGYLIVLYVVLSIVLSIGLAIYLGSTKW